MQIFVQLTEKDMEDKEEHVTDASVPRPSLMSTTSRVSLEATPTINKQALDDVFVSEKLHNNGIIILKTANTI